MNDIDIDKMTSAQKADVIRRVFESDDGSLAKRILEIHFQTDEPSAAVAEFQTNRTFYQDGLKAFPALIDQILKGAWAKEPDPDKDLNPIQSI